MRQRLTAFLLATAISTFCVANENYPTGLSGLSDEKIAAAREYYEASNIEGQMEDSMAAIFPMMTQMLTQQTGVSPPDEFLNILEAAMNRTMDEAWITNGALLEIFTIINAEIFSSGEMMEITAFFKTPVGTKLAKFSSKVTSRQSELMMPIMLEIQNRFPEVMMQEAIAFCEMNMESDFCKVIAESA